MTVLVERRSIVDDRFDKPAPKKFSAGGALLSILTMILMCSSAVYFYDRLNHPCTTFHLLDEPQRKGIFRRYDKKHTISCLDGDDSFYNTMKCLIYYQPDITTCPEDEKATWWVLFPFSAVIVGSAFGILLEVYLLISGNAFQFQATPMIATFAQFRASTLAYVLTSTLLATQFLTFHPEKYSNLLFLFINGFFFGTFALAPILYFGVEVRLIPVILLSTQLAQVFISIANESTADYPHATYVLASVGVFHLIGMLGGVDSPFRTAFYHVFATLSMVSLYTSIALVGNTDAAYATRVHREMFPEADVGLAVTSYIVSSIAGFLFCLWASRDSWQACRSMLSQAVWSTFYLMLMAEPILQANPYKLSDVYAKVRPRRLALQPYSSQHPRYMPKKLAIPSIAGSDLPETIEIYAYLRELVTKGFDMVTTLGQVFPQAQVYVPLEQKVRMSPTSDGSEYWPKRYFSLGAQFPENGLNMIETPRPMVEHYMEGQVLAYLCQYGAGNAFLKKARETDTYPYFELVDLGHVNPSEGPAENSDDEGFVLDFRHLEKFQTKPDYQPYGGVAFFKIMDNDDTSKRLEIVWLVVPRSRRLTVADKMSGTFRRGESMILASLYFSTICGKHLVEIHMTFNLLEVALQNAFDYEWNALSPIFGAHPFRLVLYVHLFSHGLAAELTVRHLIERGAVFNQIFALNYSDLCDYIQETYNDFDYGNDEDFEYREAIMKPLMDHPDPRGPSFNCSMSWETEYRRVFEKYATAMVDAMYAENKDVAKDAALQHFYRSIDEKHGGIFGILPSRHDFCTKAGVSRFISDTMYHLTVRHQVYGTNATTGALDPRVGVLQVPRDGGPPAVDEWRSTAYVALATAYPAFTNLLQDPANIHPNAKRRLEAVFEDATPITARDNIKEKKILVDKMKSAFWIMQCDLRALNEEWKKDNGGGKRSDGDDNFKYFRPLPAELHTGPGY